MERTVVIGAGHAGVQVADSLRTGGYGGSVVVLGDEIDHPYQRPPLSKDFVAEENEPAALPLRAERYFTDSRIDLRLATAARAIDRERHLVRLSDGQQLSYTTLVIATGALPRPLEMVGCDATGVTDLRTLADAKSLRKALTAARSVVVVGAGFIGLEFAAAARKRGIEVTVL
ncbi:MAG: FAD-dependent oxidoreductase, partial [Pseudonocardia sp.]|nr:FAD-dependent oxidoreductase [Pseudonocardia sp.]